jgi:pteridine reductase
MIELAGKTALITGAGRRLGRAVALALAAQGVHVALHFGRSKSDAEETAALARARGVRAWTFEMDLADAGAAERLFDAARAAVGPVDFLVNSASIFPEDTLHTLTLDSLLDNVRINAYAPFALSRCFVAQQRPGAIINFLDARIVDYDAAHAAYHLSKRMFDSLTRMMAFEFAPLVRVNAVAPGLILPPEGKDAAYLEGLAHTNPLNRHGGEADVCEAALFLLRSDFITGQTIFVDGGRHLRGAMYG